MNSHKPQLLVIVAALITLLITTGCVNVQPVAAESPAGAQANAAPAADPVDAPEVNAVTEASPVGFENVVVSTEWLAENLDNPAVRVIEVSVIPGVYERGHIPGAVNFVWHTDFVDTISRDIVSATRLQELARDAGINDDSTVVLYGDNNNWFAAWGAWVFKLYGAPDVRILDGGRAKWEAEGRELAVAAPTVEPGDFTASGANANLRAHLADVRQIVEGDVDAALIDIRSPAEFEGTIFAPEGFQELAVRAGHIPTAVNVPWAQAVNEDGSFKSVEELRELYASVGVDGSRPVVVYCRIGERASHTWFVLSQILGYDAKLYDGSWTEWGNTVGVPIENPAGTIWGAQ
ncbi:MAG: sulfurtransferase [Chloroflexota bacterium]|jgi:thiosulfate/3-mercaptopyruvate sulfurtransferase|nr:sulfurtransferase [Chloroflexota bacterium]